MRNNKLPFNQFRPKDINNIIYINNYAYNPIYNLNNSLKNQIFYYNKAISKKYILHISINPSNFITKFNKVKFSQNENINIKIIQFFKNYSKILEVDNLENFIKIKYLFKLNNYKNLCLCEQNKLSDIFLYGKKKILTYFFDGMNNNEKYPKYYFIYV